MREAVKKERRRALPALSGFNIYSEALRALAADSVPHPYYGCSASIIIGRSEALRALAARGSRKTAPVAPVSHCREIVPHPYYGCFASIIIGRSEALRALSAREIQETAPVDASIPGSSFLDFRVLNLFRGFG